MGLPVLGEGSDSLVVFPSTPPPILLVLETFPFTNYFRGRDRGVGP